MPYFNFQFLVISIIAYVNLLLLRFPKSRNSRTHPLVSLLYVDIRVKLFTEDAKFICSADHTWFGKS